MSNPSDRIVLAERHWMHIWKVGYKPCGLCSRDSRRVATYLDDNDEILGQIMYCEEHAPEQTVDIRSKIDPDDIVAQLNFGLGISFRVNLDDLDDEDEEINDDVNK